jgi:hypothetical protein
MAECRVMVVKYKRSAAVELRRGRFGRGGLVQSFTVSSVSPADMDRAFELAGALGLVAYLDRSGADCLLTWDSLTVECRSCKPAAGVRLPLPDPA